MENRHHFNHEQYYGCNNLYSNLWCDTCKAQGIPEPCYEERPGGVVIIFRKGTYAKEDFGSDFDSQLTERQKSIIKILSDNGNTTAKQLAEVFGITQRSIEKDLSFLHKNGYIEKTTEDNRSPWIVMNLSSLTHKCPSKMSLKDDTQGDTQDDTQGDTQEANLDD